jgi:hypothetical protein
MDMQEAKGSMSTGNMPHHVRKPHDFIQIINSLMTSPEDIMVISDMAPLFTCVPLNKTMDPLNNSSAMTISFFHLTLSI